MSIKNTISNHSMPQRPQISVNGEDISQKYKIFPKKVTAEKFLDGVNIFVFTFDDPQRTLVNSELFDLNKTVQIRMGTMNNMQTIMTGKITSVKVEFPSNNPPQLQVKGESKNTPAVIFPEESQSTVTLNFGSSLLGFSAEKTEEQQEENRNIVLKQTLAKQIIRCFVECIGMPDIKPAVIVYLTGLGKRYSSKYRIERTLQSFDETEYGYRTFFNAIKI
jgi:hypothetical protein